MRIALIHTKGVVSREQALLEGVGDNKNVAGGEELHVEFDAPVIILLVRVVDRAVLAKLDEEQEDKQSNRNEERDGNEFHLCQLLLQAER